jgi:uridine phosphorylase
MSYHARGLCGYFGPTPAGRELTVQATGMGGPSASLVLADLGELGLRRAVRVGSCAAVSPELALGDLFVVREAHAWGGPGTREGGAVLPHPELTAGLSEQLGPRARLGSVASLDVPLADHLDTGAPELHAEVADMQTAALFAGGASLGLAIAAVLVVSETREGERLGDEAMESAAKRAGRAALAALGAL